MELKQAMNDQDAGWVPSACTLPTAERPLRTAEFDALFARTVRGMTRPDRTRLVWDLEFTPEAAAEAAGLAAKENGCCSFFTFTLTVADGVLSLQAQVPEARVDVLDALHRRTENGPIQHPPFTR